MTLEDRVVFAIFIVIIILYLISMILRFSMYDFPQCAEYLDPENAKTGDIVCVSYNNIAGAFVGSLTHSCWVHTGMVWVDPETNIPYVLEGAIYRCKFYQQFYIIPLSSWMYINKNNLMGYKKYFGPELCPYKMIESFKPFIEKTKLEGLNPYWIRFWINHEYEERIAGSKCTCFEATVMLGQAMNIFGKKKLYSSYYPCDIIDDNIELEKGVNYSRTIEIKPYDSEKNLVKEDMVNFAAYWQK